MSAVEDIIQALKVAPLPMPNWQRVIILGASARGSIVAHSMANGIDPGPDAVFQMLLGFPVVETLEFDGWAIRDCDERGKWHEVPVAFPPLRKPNESA